MEAFFYFPGCLIFVYISTSFRVGRFLPSLEQKYSLGKHGGKKVCSNCSFQIKIWFVSSAIDFFCCFGHNFLILDITTENISKIFLLSVNIFSDL